MAGAEIEKLKHKICSRCYKFLLSKMNNLRKPNTNFQIYQESILLKYKSLMSFLKIHNAEVFKEVSDNYCKTMNELYQDKLDQYFRDTWGIIHHRINKGDLVISKENDDPAGNFRKYEQSMK